MFAPFLAIYSFYIGAMIASNAELKPGLNDAKDSVNVYPEHANFIDRVYWMEDFLFYGKVVNMT